MTFTLSSLHAHMRVVIPRPLETSLVNARNRLLPHGWRDKGWHLRLNLSCGILLCHLRARLELGLNFLQRG